MDTEPPSLSYCLAAGMIIGVPLLSSGGLAMSFLILILLLICSALVSGSEVAYFSLSPNDLNDLQTTNDTPSRRVLYLTGIPRRLLATILIANNLINIAIVLLSDQIVWRLLGVDGFDKIGQYIYDLLPGMIFSAQDYARFMNFFITVMGVTFLLVLFGEVAPKIYANLNNVKFSKVMARPLIAMTTLFKPLSSALVGMSSAMEKNLGFARQSQEYKDEIEEAIDLTVSGSLHSEREVNILKRIIKFNEVTVKQIMRSRPDVIAESDDISQAEVLETISSSGYSRIPIYHDNLDTVIGLLYAKDFIGLEDEVNWKTLIRKDVLYVPETKRINELMKEFQQKHLHMAIVVDEFGGVAGLVTLEDVMEEVIGEITDEFDEGDDIDFIKIDDNTYIFEGKTLLNDACRVMGIDTTSFDDIKGEADSIAGLMLETLGHIPRAYQELVIGEFNLRAERVNKRRIEKVKVRRMV